MNLLLQIVNATFTCEAGSIPSPCPEEGSEFLGCFPERFVCNLDSNCPGGVDEMNCTDGSHSMFIDMQVSTEMSRWVTLFSTVLLPFGLGAGDMKGARGEDEIALDIFLSEPVIFFEEMHTHIFVRNANFALFLALTMIP